ncbi:unnamed protein product, partial [Linum tenue]
KSAERPPSHFIYSLSHPSTSLSFSSSLLLTEKNETIANFAVSSGRQPKWIRKQPLFSLPLFALGLICSLRATRVTRVAGLSATMATCTASDNKMEFFKSIEELSISFSSWSGDGGEKILPSGRNGEAEDPSGAASAGI